MKIPIKKPAATRKSSASAKSPKALSNANRKNENDLRHSSPYD